MLSSAPATARTVLCVEDNVSNVKLLERILARRPEVTVMVAMLGGPALELAREHQPSLVLLDLRLPDMSGEEILRRLRAEPRTAGIPVVVLSADATPGQQQRLLGAGAADYLTKPLDIARLLAIVDGTAPPHPRGDPGPPNDEGRDSVLDPTMVAALHELDTGSGDAGALMDLVRTFIADGRAQVEELHEAARSEDYARVRQAAHSLAGSSATFGAHRVAGLCRQLESLGPTTDREAVGALLTQLDESFAEAEAVLGAEFLGSERPPSP